MLTYFETAWLFSIHYFFRVFTTTNYSEATTFIILQTVWNDDDKLQKFTHVCKLSTTWATWLQFWHNTVNTLTHPINTYHQHYCTNIFHSSATRTYEKCQNWVHDTNEGGRKNENVSSTW